MDRWPSQPPVLTVPALAVRLPALTLPCPLVSEQTWHVPPFLPCLVRGSAWVGWQLSSDALPHPERYSSSHSALPQSQSTGGRGLEWALTEGQSSPPQGGQTPAVPWFVFAFLLRRH